MRIFGLISIGLSLLAGVGLEHLIASGAPHDATASEFLLAALSFAGASIGAAMLICGAKLLEPQRVPLQWRDHR
ncbi:hypothetical protein D3876_04620 [Sphingomonas cavernae]|uniref:Uncharacterized protein n=1 Tax=Sphingomonas cavernae TaxID=2320861 RepID=A0A418WQS3_9SPHN|nr:hypothetical protein D3876_04620 [Sphingomonas cavernae]